MIVGNGSVPFSVKSVWEGRNKKNASFVVMSPFDSVFLFDFNTAVCVCNCIAADETVERYP